jgi:anti-sigma B factor antagonist
MEITARTNGNCPVLDLNGRLYLGPATKKLRNNFLEAIKKNPGKIVINMRNVTHVDSPGLGELVSCHEYAKSRGGNLVLLNPQEKQMHLLIVTKLRTVFDIFHDEGLAVADSNHNMAVA